MAFSTVQQDSQLASSTTSTAPTTPPRPLSPLSSSSSSALPQQPTSPSASPPHPQSSLLSSASPHPPSSSSLSPNADSSNVSVSHDESMVQPVDMVVDTNGGTPINGEQPMTNGQPVEPILNGDPAVTQNEAISSGHSDAEGEWSDDWMADMRRVKVYELVGSRWTDRGTALCTGIYDEDLDQAAIVAKSELTDVELLRSEIRVNDVYQRQQDTLIVWTEPDGTDYALSFQDLEGCAEIWDFIIEVQRHFRGKIDPDDPSLHSSSPSRDRPISATTIINAGRLPEPTMGIIGEIDKAIKFIGRTPSGKEKICEYIVQEDYIKGLVDVMAQAEDLESLVDLHALCNLMQTILMMNDHGIYDYILQDEIYMGVIGMLEYDPDFPTYKASFRDFLTTSTKYKEVVVFRDENVRKKIHQTYRLQYLKDVVLARVLDDPTFNVLNSFILFNQIDIINHIQQDEVVLKELFAPFQPEGEEGKGKEREINGMGNSRPTTPAKASESGASTSSELGASPASSTLGTAIDMHSVQKQDVILLIHQLTMMAKNVQIQARMHLYRVLVDRGLLYAIQWALSRTDEPQMLNAAGEILLSSVDHDVSGVRGFVLKQAEGSWNASAVGGAAGAYGGGGMAGFAFGFGGGSVTGLSKGKEKEDKKDQNGGRATLLMTIVKLLSTAKDLALRGQMAESLRMLLEIPGLDDNSSALKMMTRQREDPIAETFIHYFYDTCASTLVKPLTDLPEVKNVSGMVPVTREQSSLFLYLCDLLCNFVVQHSHKAQYFVLASNVSVRIGSLLKAKEKHLRLAALRFFRACIKMNNNFLIRHLIKHELFAPILDMTQKEAYRDNLLNSSCQEFFEHIRKENIRILVNHLVSKHKPQLEKLSTMGTVAERFRGLILRWEQNNEPPPKASPPQNNENRPALRRWGGPRNGLDAEEEEYFNQSDEDESASSTVSTTPQMTNISGNHTVKRKRSTTSIRGPPTRGSSAPRAMPTVPAGGITLPSPYPVKSLSLVDYAGDDEGEDASSPSPSESAGPSLPTASTSGSPSEAGPPTVIAPRPVLAGTRQSPITRSKSSADLSSGTPGATTPNGHVASRPRTPNHAGGAAAGSAKTTSPSPSPPLESSASGSGPSSPPRQKRRRDDDDDEMMGLLATKSKRPSLGASTGTTPPAEKNGGSKDAASKSSDSGKKIVLSLGKAAIGIAGSDDSKKGDSSTDATMGEDTEDHGANGDGG
ncbi:Platinum sensitivity protein [Tulasnella sp. 419]|nr:Platinum sensitivity protein [Tulasnella sp. 419]